MNSLANKHVLVGITGSIAAYKSVELVRRLREQEAQVRVVMTPAATEFITPLTLQAVSGERVYTRLLNLEAETSMGHIELARWAEVVLIAPASANCLAKLAHGQANDLLSTLCLATRAPILVAPAMNQQMWQAKVTQDNCERLRAYGVQFLGPSEGELACGESGSGRLLEASRLVDYLQELFAPKLLEGIKVLVTAGPTRENVDPVRFISNRSSGRMGYAMAQAAQKIGAQVSLVSGPVCLPKPSGIKVTPIYSAQEMFEMVMMEVKNTEIFIAAAAVADYRPVQQVPHKLKKQEIYLQLILERTPDILAEVASLPRPPFIVGFAAETNNLTQYALDKLQRKKLDMIAGNYVGVEGIGFESEENALSVFWKGGGIELPRNSKPVLAKELMKIIVDRYFKKTGPT